MTIHLEDFAKNYGVHNSLQCLGPGDDEGIDRMPALVSEQDSDDEDMPDLGSIASATIRATCRCCHEYPFCHIE